MQPNSTAKGDDGYYDKNEVWWIFIGFSSMISLQKKQLLSARDDDSIISRTEKSTIIEKVLASLFEFAGTHVCRMVQ